MDLARGIMVRNALKAVLVLLLMLVAGCVGAIEDVVSEKEEVIIDEVLEPFTRMMDWMEVGERQRSSPALMPYDSCEALEEDLRENLKEKMRISMLQQVYYYGGWGWGGGMMVDDGMMEMDGAVSADSAADTGGAPSAGAGQSNAGDQRSEGEDFSGTNNQEEGVDESDFVKTDGYHIYMIDGGLLVILGVPEFGQLTFESASAIEGSAREMMLAGDRLVVLSSVNIWSLDSNDPLWSLVWNENDLRMRVSSLTKFTVIDITDRTAPVVTNELYLEGWYLTAREQDGMVRTVTHGYLDLPGLKTWVEIAPEYQTAYNNLDWNHPARQAIWNASVNLTIEFNDALIDAAGLDDLMPQMYRRAGDGTVAAVPLSSQTCDDFVASSDAVSTQFTSILTLDLLSPTFSYDADHIMSNWPVVYASGDTLLLAEPAQDWWWYWGADELDEATNIHAFSLTAQGTSYIGSGRVAGTVLDQFSLSEYEGSIRLATTTGQWNRWWMNDPEPMENHVVVLQPDTASNTLVEVGRLDGIALDERIWSARFVQDRAYIVTFRQIDPLWTIDLSDPTDPRIIGELEVPGVSTYIHPLDADNVLTIGIGPANADGTGLDWSNTQISLFDVSDFSLPELASALSLNPVAVEDRLNGWTWSSSEALYEHKAFQYWAAKDLLAVPLSTYRYTYIEDTTPEAKRIYCEDTVDREWYWIQEELDEADKDDTATDPGSGEADGSDDTDSNGDTNDNQSVTNQTEEELREEMIQWCMDNYYYGGYWQYEYVSKLVLINVVPGQPLSVYGEVDHTQFYDTTDCHYCWYGSTSIRRSIFMGDYIYAISDGGVTATNLTTMEQSGSVEFADHITEDNVIGHDGGGDTPSGGGGTDGVEPEPAVEG